MEIIGFCCAVIIGIIMGLTGAGGAILTVPVLVYLLGYDPVIATAYSLFIVGTTSAFGTAQNLRKGLVNVKTALLYAIPSLVGVFVSRKFIVPQIPEIVFSSHLITITRGMLLMTLFSIIMLMAALAMLRKPASASNRKKIPFPILVLQMLIAGVIVGLVGAGGGFLFVPILIFVAKLPVKKAAATSLMIIAINSLVGFTGDLGNFKIDWNFLAMFTVFAIAGVFTGIYFSRSVNESQLKRGFGWFVLLMAIAIFTKETIL